MKRLLGSIIIMGFLGVLGFAEGPTGIRGFVYNHTGNLAGNQLHHIYIIRVDDQGSASYYYQSGTSYWITNDSYGLVAGHWAIYGETIENGVHYYSPAYYHWWYPGQLIDQDIHCTNTVPPNIRFE
uniref:Uncharacterized protein n=1 Tax=candidate division WOR-3 bacterium TaxID=2052148 RepID=A0A7C4XM75_UNCW3